MSLREAYFELMETDAEFRKTMSVFPMKKNSHRYDMWLQRDMENMGFFFEYCPKYVKQITKRRGKFNQLAFCDAFMRSECRKEMEFGHPQLFSQAAYDTVRCFIEVDLQNDVSQFFGETQQFYPMQMYWVGWIYAYLHYKADILSEDLINKMPLEEMLEEYTWGHQLSEEGFYQRVRHMFVDDPKCGYVD